MTSFYINFTFSIAKALFESTFPVLQCTWNCFYNLMQRYVTKWKLGPPSNKSNFNLSPPILALFLLNSPPPPPSGFSATLLIIIAQSLTWCHTSPLFWEEPLKRGLSACLVYLLYYGLYKYTLLAAQALISFTCYLQCDKNIMYLYISRHLYVIYHMSQIYFSKLLCKIQRPAKIPLICYTILPESEM